MSNKKSRLRTVDMIYISLFAVLIAICSWVVIPVIPGIPFTLQTLGLFCTLGLLGGRRGAWAMLIYLLLGLLGAPVFSGFAAGPGVLLGPTGGYLLGFLAAAGLYWLLVPSARAKLWHKALGLFLVMVVYYSFGTAWYMLVYAPGSGGAGLTVVLGLCVVPFILPDLLKLAAALAIMKRLGPHLHLDAAGPRG